MDDRQADQQEPQGHDLAEPSTVTVHGVEIPSDDLLAFLQSRPGSLWTLRKEGGPEKPVARMVQVVAGLVLKPVEELGSDEPARGAGPRLFLPDHVAAQRRSTRITPG